MKLFYSYYSIGPSLLLVHGNMFGLDFIRHQLGPSKCPTFYTNRVLGKQNLRQKVRNFCQNLNCDKMIYLIKYTLTLQFLIKDYTRQLRNKLY